MKVLLLWGVVFIASVLAVWVSKGNGSIELIEINNMWWHVPAFFICGSGVFVNGCAIFKTLF